MSYTKDFPIPTGSYLGSMEIEKPDYDILEYVSAGCKQYSLKLRHKVTGEIKHEMKLRGFTLDSSTSDILNYESFRKLCLENTEVRKFIEVSYKRLQPDIRGGVETHLDCKKRYAPVFRKGFVGEDSNTIYPFGYMSSKENGEEL